MKRNKLLAEWFWTDRWMGSSAFLLPQEARGVYREMLTQAWMRGASLPNDHEAIRRATGTTLPEWKRSWPRIERYWRVDGDVLVNDTQCEVYAEAKAAAEGNSARARAAADARFKRTSSITRAMPDKCPPSPSPSRETNNAPTDTRARARDTVLRPGAPDALFGPAGRVGWERECQELSAEGGRLMNLDPVEVMRKGKWYRDGAPTGGFNPASWSNDRLLNTVLDLRELVRTARATAKAAEPLGRG